MATLVSPGVSVTVTDESFFIPVAAPTVPLIFIATADEKLRADGSTDAEGTFEHSVVRTITSLKQSTEVYGIPNFLEDGAGQQYHGDARNEYGLFALNQFLGIGNRAFVVRANVNLNDNLDDIRDLWDSKIADAATILENLTSEFINEYNSANNLLPGLASLFVSQTQANYDGTGVAPNGNGTFTGGDGQVTTPYAIGDTITLNNGAIVTATGVDANGDVTNFTVTTPAGAINNAALTQISTSGLGAGFTLTPLAANLATQKTTVNGTELLSLLNDATQFIFDPIIGSFSFIPTSNEFFADLSSTPLDVFGNGYGAVPTGSYVGAEGITNNPATYPAYATATSGEWTPNEAGDFVSLLGGEFKFTQNFLTNTSLGANDAARRVAITSALAAAINSNTDVRSDQFDFNLILAPGYPEVVDELLALVADVRDEALVIADTPVDRTPETLTTPGTGWSSSTARQSSIHAAYYYPWPLASNLDGRDVVVSPAGTALRQYAYSDNVSFLWFAPAGVRRGTVTGISNVGYVEGQLGGPTDFVPVALNDGQRDALYQYGAAGNINPIAFFPGQGFMLFGQKTSAPQASALDRVNVSRLVKYIKRQLRRNTLSYVFEPNDALTRDNLKATVDNFLGDLIIKRGLYDFATVCDETNNTPDRIDRNEMYIDVALKPVKAAEFIFIPIRIVATGADI